MRFGKVLIAIDFSDQSITGARWAARHFGAGAELVLAHIIDIPQPPSFLRGKLPPHGELVETTRQGAHHRLREVGDTLGADRIWTEIRVGRAAEQILALADETGADLIVVGDHARRRGLWSLLGSTADRVIEQARVPVLLAAQPPAGAPGLLLAPVDTSEHGAAVLDAAHSLAQQFGASLMPLHVFDPRLYGRVQLARTARGTDEEGSELRLSAEQWLEQRITDAGIDRERTMPRVALGVPSYEIMAAAQREGADLIVMASRGSGGVGRLLLGSVARAVLRGAPCPVLVLRADT